MMTQNPLPDPIDSPLPAPSPQRGPWLFLGAVGALGALLLGIVLLVAPKPQQRTSTPATLVPVAEARLPDGTILRLESVTYGKHHRLDVPVASKGRWSPGPSTRTISESTSEDRIMVWFTRRGPARGECLDFSWWSHCVALDEQGHEIYDDHPGQEAISENGSSGTSGSRPLPAMSRQDLEQYDFVTAYSTLRLLRNPGKFKLRVFNTSNQVVAEFDVPSPVSGPFPDWQPEPIPSTKRAGDLAVTLTQLRPRTYHDGSRNNAVRLQLNPEFKYEQASKPTEQWSNAHVEVSDPLGNTSNVWGCDLSPHERAWKLKVTLFRNDKAKFDASELFEVPGNALPQPYQSAALSAQKDLQGVKIEVVAVGGSGTTRYHGLSQGGGSSSGGFGDSDSRYEIRSQQGVMTVECTQPHLIFRVTGQTPDHHVAVTATDDQGREAPLHQTAYSGLTFAFIKPAAGAKSLNFKFMVQKYRRVEFFVAPPQLEPKPSSP